MKGKRGRKRFNTKGIVADYLPWILIAVAVLVVLTIGIFVMRDKGVGLVDRLKGLFSGR